MKTSTCQLHPLTKKDLIFALKNMKPSAPGLDHFSPAELKVLSEWVPDVYEHVAELFNHIEKTGIWPTDLTKGAVSFLPKADDDHPAPSDLDLSQYLVRCIDSGLPSDTTDYANFGCQLGNQIVHMDLSNPCR